MNDVTVNQISQLLLNESVPLIVKKHEEVKVLKEQNAYNLFSLSTYTSHLENFHSDVIASFLNSTGLHAEGNKLLKEFIEFLNSYHNFKLNVDDYEHAEVLREKGRIDIWIRNKNKCKAILIENKINNAGDREDQINDYHDYSETKGNCKVEAIIYLTLDGSKLVPLVNENIKNLIRNVAAFKNEEDDLVNGWLTKCLPKCEKNADTSALLNQYIKLLKHLSNKKMDTNTLKDFYSLIKEKQAFESLQTLVQLSGLLPSFRTDQFVAEIGDDKAPFGSVARWKPNYVLYDHYREGMNSFKMDIHFMEDIGNASILFWNPPFRNETGAHSARTKLSEIGLLEDFEVYENFGYAKFFRIGDPFQTLEELDKGIVRYVQNFLQKLRSNIQSVAQ